MAFTVAVRNAPATIPLKNTGVAFVREDLALMFPAYNLISDCLDGSDAVKAKGDVYLPRPDPANTSDDNLLRYEAYRMRAIFYNVTQRTALGLQGQIFLRPPHMKVPESLQPVVTDSNGAGISIEQLARDAEWFVASRGRAGLFIDYPPQDKPASKAQLQAGNIRPTISVYGPTAVVNWRTASSGAKKFLSLVVLYETYTVEDTGFETKEGVQYRELRLIGEGDNAVYTVQLWRASKPDGDDFAPFGPAYTPRDGKGNVLKQIPFTFIGSKNNEPTIDPPPLKDMAEINMGHYRNSADYEELVYVVGQPTLVIAGLTKEWYEDILKKKVPFGSRSGIPLPTGATAELIQVQPNTVAKEAMEHKERQMVALGAKLVQQAEVQRTATEAGNETASEESVLSAIAKNVSAAFKYALEWCAVFLNTSEKGIEFALNDDFEIARLTPEQQAAVIKAWQDEAISWTEMRVVLRKSGMATQEDDEAKKEIEADATKAIERAAKEIGATTAAQVENGPPQQQAA